MAFTTILYFASNALTRYTGYTLLYQLYLQTQGTKGWLIQAGELCTCCDTIRNQTNPYRPASLWNTTRSRSSCTFKQGKHCHTQPDQQFPCHSSALGHWPEPAGALVGRFGPTAAPTEPSALPERTSLYRTLLCMGTRTLRTRATPQAHAPPGTPLHCRSPTCAPHSHDHLPMVGNTFPMSPWMWQCSQHCASPRCTWLALPPPNSIFSSLFSIYIYL